MSLDSSNVQHEKLVLKLVAPVVPGFSVPSTAPTAAEEKEEQTKPGKRDCGAMKSDTNIAKKLRTADT